MPAPEGQQIAYVWQHRQRVQLEPQGIWGRVRAGGGGGGGECRGMGSQLEEGVGPLTLKFDRATPFPKFNVGTTKHNWSAWCQYNVTGWVSMWACDMLSQ